MFQAQGPDGKTYNIDAPDEQSAQAAFQEMMSQGMSGGGGQETMAGGNGGMSFDDLIPEQNRQAPAPQQGQGGPMTFDDIGQSPQDRFRTAFDRSQDDPNLAQALDQNVNAEADTRGRFAVAGNAATMGLGDEVMGLLAGGLTFAAGDGFSKGYDTMTGAIRGDIDRYTQRHPVEAAAIDIGASLPTAAIGGGAGALGKAPLAMKMVRGAVGGAAYGGARGYAEGRGGVDQRLEGAGTGAAVGAGVGAAAPAIGQGIGKVAGKIAGRKAVPTVEKLNEAASKLYDKADNAGVAIQPNAMVKINTILPRRMSSAGFDAQLHPNTARAIARVDNMAKQSMQGPLSLREVENTRRVIRQAISASSGPDKKADQAMAMKVLDEFDNWMNSLQPRDMINGKMTGREAIQTVNEARSLWSRQAKGDTLADLVERAKLDDNFERALRREFKSLAKNERRMKVFTPDERKAIRNVAKGGNMGWVLNAIGSFAPGASPSGAVRGAIGGSLGFAATGGNPVGAAAALGVAAGAKQVGNAMTRGAARKADAMVRAGGRLPIDEAARAAAAGNSTLLLGGAGQAAGGRLTRP